MGCFNISGFYSHLPIKAGDRIGAVLCAHQTCDENIGMSTDSLGIYPLMTPIYGEYDEYGGIENIDSSLSADIFKNLAGIDFASFVDMNGRNGGVTLNSEDNGNQFDDIPGYQAVIKNLVAKHIRTYSKEEIERVIKESESSGDKTMLERYIHFQKYEDKQETALMNTSFLVIYEHEDIIKQLIKIGEQNMNTDWHGTVYDASKDYDTLASYVDKFNVSIFSTREISVHDRVHMFPIEQMLEIDMAERQLLTDNIKFCDMFGSVYKNQKIDHAVLKNDILDLLYLNSGLHYMNGMFAPSTYAGQDIYIDNFKEMLGVFNNIVSKIE